VGEPAFTVTRLGVIMAPDPSEVNESLGVLNPGCARSRDGELFLFPRLAAEGNYSRVGRARVLFDGDAPVGVERLDLVLEPDEVWERNAYTGGVEDPRITFVEALDVYLMAYSAYGPLGSRIGLAFSRDLEKWERLGPAWFAYEPGLAADLNLYPNKDAAIFPEPVSAPDGTLSIAILHRPMWDLGEIRTGQGVQLPAGIDDARQSIWISYVPVGDVLRDVANLVHWRGHRFLAGPEYPFEEVKIGGGPAPLRVPEGWLLLHHGVTGHLAKGITQQQRVNYAAGAILLDADDPSKVLARTPEPLLAPETDDERTGIVPNVVFPTAVEEIDGAHYVFYGMADSKIGVARLERSAR
jgi:beta-1,2-mannobiose phosphorylase / 1,2-beta-oligomannan phosphorylase